MGGHAPRGAEFGPLWGDLAVTLCHSSLRVLGDLGFARATPVQAAVVPLLCTNKDVAVEACTGSGKTLAFVLPLVEILLKAHVSAPLKKHDVAALVVSPTRELAKQTLEVLAPFLSPLPPPGALLLVGGSDPSVDVNRFYDAGAHVLVGTPGRLDDVLTRSGALSLRRLELLVLDEADRLLSMGFAPQVNAIIRRLPKQRRTGLFSATQTEEVQELARAGLRNPMRITVRDSTTGGGGGAPSKTPSQLRLLYATSPNAAAKLPLLVSFLRRYGSTQKVLVYFLTCACVDYYAHALPLLAPDLGGTAGAAAGIITALHGRMEQTKRQRALEAFASATHGVLLATDVAARGLDIPGVDWVVQFDPPQDPDAFVHRCGRTARMGAHGSAVVFLLPHEDSYIDFLGRRGVAVAEAQACDLRHKEDGDEQQVEQTTRAMCDILRAKAEAEREHMDRGVRAFVSFVRGYQEHSCRFIFRVRELDLGALALALGLLRLPRMPETRHLRKERDGSDAGGAGFVPSAVDPETVPYKDKTREKQRQQRLAQQAAEAPKQHGQGGRRAQQADAAAAHAAPAALPHRLPAQKRRQVQQREDDDDLDADWRMLKKLKAGKVSEHEYNVACGLSEDDEEGEAAGGGGDKRQQAVAPKKQAGHKQLRKKKQQQRR